MATIEELEREMTPLCHLCRKYGSDKGGAHLIAGDTCHNYTPAYHGLFKDRREQVKWVLEIGINYGPSLRMWKHYFPNAQIIGIDSNEECMRDYGERIHCYVADQYNERDLMAVLDAVAPVRFDLIVDDGSHEPAHQIFSAQCLLPHLAKDGYYVIEDIYPDCQPELIGNPICMDETFKWHAISTGRGLGKAHCGCGCGQGEQLVVIRWNRG
jgi:hypothetical protein